MLDIEEINKEIEKLENRETSYSVCEKLAVLYTVRDHMMKNKNTSPMVSNEIPSPLR